MILSHFKWTIEYAHLSTFNQSSLLNCDVNFSKDILEKDLNRLLFRPFLLLSSLPFFHSQRCTSFQLEHLINSCFISFDSWFIRSVECIQNKRFTHHSWIMWIVRFFLGCTQLVSCRYPFQKCHQNYLRIVLIFFALTDLSI